MPPAEPLKRAASEAAPRGDLWKSARRERLLDAAQAAVGRVGPAVAMDDIAAEAGVARVVLYRYFGDKAGLYHALAERYVWELMARLRAALDAAQSPRRRLRATIEAYVSFIEENEEAYAFLMHRAVREGPAAQATIADFMRRVAHEVGNELVREMTAAGADPAPAPAWAHGMVGMVHLATDWWLRQTDVPRERFIDHLVALLTRGLFGDAT